jgi:hypothetical protein
MRLTEEARWRLPILTVVALVVRGSSIGNPIIQVDEEFYFTVAKAMWSGAIPYVDLWDRKPIGLFALYMPAARLPGLMGIYAYQLMAAAFVVATGMVVARLADLAGWRRGALWAGIAYVVWLPLLGGVGGQSPVFYNLLMGCAALLTISSPEDSRRARALIAMAFVGIALQIKYSVVFEGIFLGLWMLWEEHRDRASAGRILVYGLALVAVALAPTLAVSLAYAHLGELKAFVFANFQAIFARGPNPFWEAAGNLGVLVLVLSPLVAMALPAWRSRASAHGRERGFLLLWLAASVAGVIGFGTWYDHYGLPVVLPASACAAAFFGLSAWNGRATPAVLLLALAIGQVRVSLDRTHRGTAAQFARLSQEIGRGHGCLYVYSGHALLHATTGRCFLTPYIFPSFLIRPRENGAMGVEQWPEVSRILARKPDVVVMAPPYMVERLDIRRRVEGVMSRDYRPPSMVKLGDEQVAVYRLQ